MKNPLYGVSSERGHIDEWKHYGCVSSYFVVFNLLSRLQTGDVHYFAWQRNEVVFGGTVPCPKAECYLPRLKNTLIYQTTDGKTATLPKDKPYWGSCGKFLLYFWGRITKNPCFAVSYPSVLTTYKPPDGIPSNSER